MLTVDTFQVKYIAQCIEEIKAELKQENIAVKANAVAKLSYVCFALLDVVLHFIRYQAPL